MKKFLKVLVFGSFLFTSLIACEKEETNNGNNTNNTNENNNTAEAKLTGIALNADNVKKTYTYGDALDLTGLVVNANYDDNTSKAVTSYTTNPANGAALNSLGDVAVTVTYEEKTASFNVTVAKALTGITLDTTNVKKDYVYGDALSTNGLVVKANYNDGSDEVVTDYTVTPANGAALTEGGENSIKVTYNGFNSSYKVMVDKSATGITIDATNAKKNFHYGEKFDTTGLVVNVVYANGVEAPISDYTLNIAKDTELKTLGSQEVTVSFGDYTKKYEINVEAGEAFVDHTDVKKTYHYGDALDYTGLKVGYRYSDGSVEYTNDYRMGNAEGSVIEYVGNINIHVYLTDHNGTEQDFSFTISFSGEEETGTHLSVNLADMDVPQSNDWRYATIRPAANSNYSVLFRLVRVSTKEGAMTPVNGDKFRFLEGDYIENVDSLGGVTKIRVNGGNGNFRLFAGYSQDDMHEFLTAESENGDRVFDNVPHINYIKLVGKYDNFPADISSIEFDYTRDADNNVVNGQPTAYNTLNLTSGSFVKGSMELTAGDETIIIGSDFYDYTGIVYNGCPVYKNAGDNIYISLNNVDANTYVVNGLTDPYNTTYAGTYYKYTNATSVAMFIDGVQTSPNFQSQPITINEGDSFAFTATSNAIPAEVVQIELVDDTNGEIDPYVGVYTPIGDIPVQDVNGGIGDFDLTIESVEIEKDGNKYWAYYEDVSIADYPGCSDIYEATVSNGFISFGDDKFSFRIDTNEKEFNFVYEDEDIGDGAFCFGDVDYRFAPTTKPTATLNDGVVTATNGGNFHLVCTTRNNLTSILYFTVIGRVPATVTVTETSIELNEGQFYYIQATVNEDAADKTLTYTSANPSIAKVDGNMITGVSAGETTVTVKTVDNNTATITVKVKASAQEIVYTFEDDNGDPHELVVYVGDEAYLDNDYIFEFISFNGNEWYRLIGDEDVGFVIRISGAQAYLDFFDYSGEVFSDYGPVYNFSGTISGTFFLEEQTSGQSGGGGTAPIVIIQTINYTFTDDNNDDHTVAVVENLSITIDDTYRFNYNFTLNKYVYTADSSVTINIRKSGATFLDFEDPDMVVFGYYGPITLYDLYNGVQIYEA